MLQEKILPVSQPWLGVGKLPPQAELDFLYFTQDGVVWSLETNLLQSCYSFILCPNGVIQPVVGFLPNLLYCCLCQLGMPIECYAELIKVLIATIKAY